LVTFGGDKWIVGSKSLSGEDVMKRISLLPLVALVMSASTMAATTYDFESFTLGSSFSGVAGEFQVQTLAGDPLRIDDRTGAFSQSLPGLGGNVLAEVPIGLSIPDFEFVFERPIDYFEIYVLDAEESFQVTSDTGLTASVTPFGSGPGGPVRRVQLGAIDGPDRFTRVIVDVTNGTPAGGGAGPGPWDLLTFNLLPAEVDVDMAINPRVVRDCLNQRPVVLYGSAELDVIDIDIASLAFGSAEAAVGAARCNLDYVNEDSILDLVCRFVPGTTEVSLVGQLLDGTPIAGADTICAAQ
jgi:hypothetical protein